MMPTGCFIRLLPQPPRHAPLNAKRRQDFSCRRGSVACRSGKPKDLRCSFQSSGMFFIICAMDNPSGSAPFTIASTMSGARLFKPSTRVTYGGFKPSFAAKSVIFFASPLISISIHRCPLRIARSKDCCFIRSAPGAGITTRRCPSIFLLSNCMVIRMKPSSKTSCRRLFAG